MNQITFETQILTPLYTQLTANAARPALYIQDNTYTYYQLSQRIAAIRTYLQENHLGGQPIALLADDHIDTYASIIALWSEGCAYIPLHPLQPPTRNISILQQTQTKYLLCTTPQSPTAQQAFNTGLSSKQNISGCSRIALHPKFLANSTSVALSPITKLLAKSYCSLFM